MAKAPAEQAAEAGETQQGDQPAVEPAVEPDRHHLQMQHAGQGPAGPQRSNELQTRRDGQLNAKPAF